MRTFPFGPERRPLSRIVFGTFPLDGRDWGATDDALSVRAIHAALDAGIDAFDTAPAYGPEHSERILGRALREWPDVRAAGPAPFVATKVGVRWNTVRYYQDLSAASVREECEASLRRLAVPVIDLLQIHWPHGETPLAATLGALEALRAEGKIRFIGVSNFDVPLLEEAVRHATIDCLQPPYHLFMRGIEQQILPWCRAHGVPTLGYGALCKGLLTGKFRDGVVPEDIRRADPFFGPEVLPKLLPIVERLVALAAELRITPGQLAMAYALSRPGLSAVIAGARTPEQARENAAAGDIELDARALAAVEELIAAAPHVA